MIKHLCIVFLLSLCCVGQVSSRRTDQSKCEPFIYERLRNYFELNELKPTQVINNDPVPNRWESRTEKIVIGDQTVEWIDVVEKNSSRSSVRINGEQIALWDKTTINHPDEDQKFEMHMIGEWDQIKLYKLPDQTIVGISMRPSMCTGLMCGVGAQLWYDVKSKQKTFFGTYRTDSDVRLFQWSEKNKVYVVSTNFQGDPHGSTGSRTVKYEMYVLGSDGRFEVQRDARGIPYSIKHTSYPDMELIRSTMRRRKSVRVDSIEQNWIEDAIAIAQ